MPDDVFIHETAVVDEGAEIGAGSKVWHFSHILSGSQIGRDVIIGQNVMVGPDVSVGDGCKIQNNVSVYNGVTLEDGVFCGPSCVFTNVNNPRTFYSRKNAFESTLVRKGATLGANATIICGSTIGRFALVGAGAVVKGHVRDYSIVAGVPARHMGWACKCGEPLRFSGNAEARCATCQSTYRDGGKELIIVKEEI
ncbi:MAG: N-acetyltransferase [Thermodesulfovibrionales bacterium]|nr:N-acetyltransferase [Thermodesulfovibrionales bacterium]